MPAALETHVSDVSESVPLFGVVLQVTYHYKFYYMEPYSSNPPVRLKRRVIEIWRCSICLLVFD